MSITYNIKKEGITGTVPISNSQIGSEELSKILSQHLKIPEKDLLITNPITGQKFMQNQTLKDKYTVNVEKITRTEKPQTIAGIVSNEQLGEMAAKARFFMIKSSNEENIQKARQFSVWATTFANQDKLRSAMLYTPHVFLFFATNRSSEIKGLARMETEPSKIPDKALWSGVSNIRLGGNFQIKWIRKKPLTSLQIQKNLGTQARDRIMRLSDGEQIDGQLCQKVVQIFQVPTQPYYQPVQKQQKPITEGQKKIPALGDILQSTRQIPITFPIPFLQVLGSHPASQQQMNQERRKQKKKSKSCRKKKSRSSSSSSQSDSDSSQSSSSSSRSRSRRKRKMKSKEKHRERSRDRKKSKKEKKSRKNKKEKHQKRKHKEY